MLNILDKSDKELREKFGRPDSRLPAYPVREATGYEPEEAGHSGVPEKGNGTEAFLLTPPKYSPTQMKTSGADPPGRGQE